MRPGGIGHVTPQSAADEEQWPHSHMMLSKHFLPTDMELMFTDKQQQHCGPTGYEDDVTEDESSTDMI